ncbi:MAG: hypothetical protein P1U57_04830 [Oleibacter sp.]|nr:hypothetical protein [Thalassolituus sp.]
MTDREEPNVIIDVRWCILSFIAGLIVAVITLEFYGYIYHPTEQDRATVADLKILSLSPEFQIEVSAKSSGKEAFCDAGYVLIRPQNDSLAAGVLVDEKNRGIHCKMNLKPRQSGE